MRNTATSRARSAIPCLPVFLLSLCPLAVVFGANAGSSPLDPLVLGRFAVGSLAVASVLLWALRMLIPDFAARSLWLSGVFLGFAVYMFVLKVGRSLGASWHPGSAIVATIYSLLVVLFVTVAARPWQRRARDPVPMTIAAIALVGVNLYLGVSRMWANPESAWRGPADAFVSSTVSSPVRSGTVAGRDIYYIVLDAFGRPDTLQTYYGLDLNHFVGFLKSKGFYVADRAQSNYAQTFLSLSSALNMNYLDPLAAAVGRSSSDNRPLEYLIQKNALMQIARRSGHRIVAIGSDTDTTQHLDAADVCICERWGLDSLEQAAIATTPLGALPLDRWTIDAHRLKILHTFDAIADPELSTGRTFVFAHVMAPHPPFVLGPGGTHPAQSGLGLFMFNDGDQFNSSTAEYVSGYHDQVLFVTERLEAVINTLLSRPGPPPVIVLHGDHGPGSRLHWEDASSTDMVERMSIFAAYYFPDGGSALYPSITPINAARALASEYMGTDLSFLSDKSEFSTLSRPYDFVPVLPPPATSGSTVR